MGDSSEQLVAVLATGPWRPKSLMQTREPELALRVRVGVLALIVALHCLGAWWLLGLLESPPAPLETVLVLDFTELEPLVPPALQPTPRTRVKPRPPETARLPPRPSRILRREARQVIDTPLQAQPDQVAPGKAASPVTSDPAPELRLHDPDGRLRVPDDMLDQIDRQVGDKQVFSYQIPGLDDARKYFERNPALVYEKTRFDQYWTPDQDMLTSLLATLAEKTTPEVRIPLPGRSNSTLICRVSILALGGGCGVLTPGADYVGPLDDPETLNPEEARQCAAWWEQIIGARTQAVWRKTRDLYEQECRKPLARPS